ncbi:TipAS antibiotic-recognition domain-containing protein, partial [Saccharothrix sp. ST-888]|uniref:TipAS antibiotic-recognition domain-containing protein n=1 Tax=Saccharothrix sp. ST-888 TaxID=1427391 RepID=UPI001E2BBC89
MAQAHSDQGHRKRRAQVVRMPADMPAGAPTGAPGAQPEVGREDQALAEVQVMDAAQFRASGQACVDNEQWRAAYEAIAAGLAEYQRDAIQAYA